MKSSHTIELSEDRSYIKLKYYGAINRKVSIEVNQKAHALGKKHGIRKYLVDVTECINTESPVDHFDFAYSDLKHSEGIDHGAIVAMIVANNDSSHDFIETVMNNAGFNVKLFRDDMEGAISYLAEYT